jgi:hypothetical protein
MFSDVPNKDSDGYDTADADELNIAKDENMPEREDWHPASSKAKSRGQRILLLHHAYTIQVMEVRKRTEK